MCKCAGAEWIQQLNCYFVCSGKGGHQQIAKWESLSGQTNNMLRNEAFWEPEEGLQKIRALPALSNFAGTYQQASPLKKEAYACFSFIFMSPCTALPLLLLPQKNTSYSLLSSWFIQTWMAELKRHWRPLERAAKTPLGHQSMEF